MRVRTKFAFVIMLCGLALCVLRAQDQPRHRSSSSADPANAPPQHTKDNQRQDGDLRLNDLQSNDLQLNDDDRLSLIAAALDARVRRDSEHDCSHLVHAIYEQAGFPYAYAPSSDLYAGVEGFQRVKQPQPGDLIVWRGHAGIVVQPSKHIFFSFMTSGPGTDDYQTPYWKGRGHPRFYRYIKNESCAECSSPKSSRRLLKVKR